MAPALLVTSLAAASRALPSRIAPAGPSEAAPCDTALPFPLPCLSPLPFPLPLFALVSFPPSPSTEPLSTLSCLSCMSFGTWLCLPCSTRMWLIPWGCKPSWPLSCLGGSVLGAVYLNLQAHLSDDALWQCYVHEKAIVPRLLQCTRVARQTKVDRFVRAITRMCCCAFSCMSKAFVDNGMLWRWSTWRPEMDGSPGAYWLLGDDRLFRYKLATSQTPWQHLLGSVPLPWQLKLWSMLKLLNGYSCVVSCCLYCCLYLAPRNFVSRNASVEER